MPSWFDFVTVEARTVLVAAGVTARQDGRTEVSVDDVALALVGQRDGAVSDVWRRFAVDRDRLVDRLWPEGPTGTGGPAVRLDATARILWEQAYGAALDSRAGRLGTRHLLIALLETGPATLVAAFADAGITAPAVRALPDRVRDIERLPDRPGVLGRWRWRSARWRRMVRRHPVATVTPVAAGTALALYALVRSLA